MKPSDAVLLGLWTAVAVGADLYFGGMISFLIGR